MVGRLRACVLGVLGALLAAGPAAANPPPRPHIVILLADDLGFGDVGFQGSEIATPEIDRLAASGVRLDQFYVWPICSPTRAALLTGRYPTRYGLQGSVVVPHAAYGLPPEERTLAEALREVGYRTALVGKWHLGHAAPEQLPRQHGFDHQYGHYNGQVGYFTHEREGGLDWHRDDRPLREPGYATDLIAAEAARLIEAHDPAVPLLLYVPFLAPHTPLQAPRGAVPAGASQREVYGAMVRSLDAGIGRVLAALDARGMRSQTLVIFTSDNGANEKFGGDNGPLRGGKYTPYEGGVRVPAVVSWADALPAGVTRRAPMHVIDWYPTLLALAGASPEQPLPVDGVDQWSLLADGGASARDEMLLYSFRGGAALRQGQYKLVVRFPPSPRGRPGRRATPDKLELFDLEADPGETENLVMKQRPIAFGMSKRVTSYREEAVPELRVGPPPPGFRAPAVWGDFGADPTGN